MTDRYKPHVDPKSELKNNPGIPIIGNHYRGASKLGSGSGWVNSEGLYTIYSKNIKWIGGAVLVPLAYYLISSSLKAPKTNNP